VCELHTTGTPSWRAETQGRLYLLGDRTTNFWEEEDVLEPVGGDVPRRGWTLQAAVGDTIVEGGDSGSAKPPRQPYDYFVAVFAPYQLVRIVELTNKKLVANRKPQLTTGELLNFLGVLTGDPVRVWSQGGPAEDRSGELLCETRTRFPSFPA
jgi:hypothetical protein